jgi:hypothetical protein
MVGALDWILSIPSGGVFQLASLAASAAMLTVVSLMVVLRLSGRPIEVEYGQPCVHDLAEHRTGWSRDQQRHHTLTFVLIRALLSTSDD